MCDLLSVRSSADLVAGGRWPVRAWPAPSRSERFACELHARAWALAGRSAGADPKPGGSVARVGRSPATWRADGGAWRGRAADARSAPERRRFHWTKDRHVRHRLARLRTIGRGNVDPHGFLGDSCAAWISSDPTASQSPVHTTTPCGYRPANGMDLHGVPMMADAIAGLDDDQIEPQRQPRHGRSVRQHAPVEQPVRGRPDTDSLAVVDRLLRRGRSRARPASGPRRRPAPRADPGRPPRGRARGDRHGRSGPGPSSRRPRVARRRAPRRHHPPVGPPFEPGRRVGPPSLHRRRRTLSGAYRRPSRRQPDLDVQAGAVSSSDARSSASSIASSAITGISSRASSAWVSSDADGSASRSSSS